MNLCCSQLTSNTDHITNLIQRLYTAHQNVLPYLELSSVSNDIHRNIILQLEVQGSTDLHPFSVSQFSCGLVSQQICICLLVTSEPQFQGCFLIYVCRVMGQNFNVCINHCP